MYSICVHPISWCLQICEATACLPAFLADGTWTPNCGEILRSLEHENALFADFFEADRTRLQNASISGVCSLWGISLKEA